MRRALALAALALALLPTTPAGAASSVRCTTPPAADGYEPPCNPHLADSAWPAAHRGGYAQASSPLPAPASAEQLDVRHASVLGLPIVLSVSAPYADGGTAVWGTTAGAFEVLKLDHETGRLIDEYRPQLREGQQASPGSGSGSPTTGIYNLLDRDNRLIVGRGRSLEVYGDSVPGQRLSPIALVHRLELPDRVFCRGTDRLVGIAMLWDGMVAFASQQGMVGVVPRQPERMRAAELRTLSLNGPACADPETEDGELETISNSIAVDDEGGIYPVTSRAQYKLRWTGRELRRQWAVEYETGGGEGGARVGSGSGSTPTLMGTQPGRDRFVVITDGQPLMHLVLLWRDRIPGGWEAIAPGKDRRIACEVPVDFGDPEARESVSEQSVVVRGYASLVVNNRMRSDPVAEALPAQARPFTALAGQVPQNAPYGLQRIDWDTERRTCVSRWANREISIPNGVPAVSSATGLAYGIGQRDGTWGLEAVDFESGDGRFFAPTSARPDENSFFAGATIGPDATLYTGTFGGITSFRPR